MAFTIAMAMAQRQRRQLRQEQALLVARAHEEERAWVASELHDDVLQRVALVRAEVESLWAEDEPRSAVTLEDRLRGINAELVDLAVAVRRIAARLHPTVVDQLGLVPALESLRDEIERGADVDVRIVAEGSQEGLSPDTARAAYRIVQESLRNVVRHSGARAARVALSFSDRALRLTVEDDGTGFDASRPDANGLGLASLKERALIVGGTAEVKSERGRGTVVQVSLPLESR
ncbi:MAG TPA: sensor histidine kinase [Gemmatimonadaceae bacterium]|nr:sensor histidine kinase [Gemmatimonadaceae bacterium]